MYRAFHGTKLENVKFIAKDGFKIEKNKVSAYGVGTYCSPNCSISMKYTDKVSLDNQISYVFICDCLVGTIGLGSSNTKITKYDSCVNDIKNPSIYCFPNNSMLLPKYVVAFHALAKW